MVLGIHAVLFKEKIASETEHIVSLIKATGAEVFEMGARFFDITKQSEFKAVLDAAGITISGLHVANNLVDFLDKPEACREKLIAAAQFLKVFPYKNIIMTGSLPVDAFDASNLGDDRLLDRKSVIQIAQTIEKLYREIYVDYGVTINYHNHNWEFKNGALIFDTLWKYAPSLKFALDIGWSGISGFDCLSLMQRDPSRFCYLHLRNYRKKEMAGLTAFKDIQNYYVPISEGDIDYKELFEFLNTHKTDEHFCIVEYETGEEDANRYTSALTYLETLRYSK